MKIIIITAICFAVSMNVAIAQTKQFQYYFDENFTPSSAGKSVFKGIGQAINDNFEFRLYTLADNKLISIEHYTDSSLNTEDGLFAAFSNNKLLSQGNYVMGKKEGIWMRWDSLGLKSDSCVFKNSDQLSGAVFYYNAKKHLYKMTVRDFTTNQISDVYYDDEPIVYKTDSVIHDNDEDKVFTKVEIEASFPGGEAAWRGFISSTIRNNIDAITDDRRSIGTCRVRFIVDKDGSISDVRAVNMVGSKLATIMIEVIKHGPKWRPALQNGIPVKAFREQPVAFKFQDR